MNWSQWVLFILQLTAQIITQVVTVEKQVGPGNGPAKKELVASSAMLAANLAGATPEQTDKVGIMIRPNIDTTVATLNQTGVFTKSQK